MNKEAATNKMGTAAVPKVMLSMGIPMILSMVLHIGSQTGDEVILAMGSSYLFICTAASFGILLFSIYEKLLQATGKTIYSTAAQILGAACNIILDPILIFGLFGMPEQLAHSSCKERRWTAFDLHGGQRLVSGGRKGANQY